MISTTSMGFQFQWCGTTLLWKSFSPSAIWTSQGDVCGYCSICHHQAESWLCCLCFRCLQAAIRLPLTSSLINKLRSLSLSSSAMCFSLACLDNPSLHPLQSLSIPLNLGMTTVFSVASPVVSTRCLSLLALQLLMQPSLHFALLTMSTCHLLSFTLVSSVIPSFFSALLLFSQAVPILSLYMGLFCPRGRTMDSLLKFLILAASSRPWRSAWRVDSLFVLSATLLI